MTVSVFCILRLGKAWASKYRTILHRTEGEKNEFRSPREFYREICTPHLTVPYHRYPEYTIQRKSFRPIPSGYSKFAFGKMRFGKIEKLNRGPNRPPSKPRAANKSYVFQQQTPHTFTRLTERQLERTFSHNVPTHCVVCAKYHQTVWTTAVVLSILVAPSREKK